MATQERRIGWNVPLGMPKLENPKNYVEGQRATTGGVWYCKGGLGEREYDIETNTFKPTGSELGKRLTNQVKRAGTELAKVQDIYVSLGSDPDLHNANHEIEFSFEYDPASKDMQVGVYGWRTGEWYKGRSVRGAVKQYRKALETKFGEQLKVRGYNIEHD